MPHWLFVNGVQPAIPENAPLEKPVTKRPKLAVSKAASAAKPIRMQQQQQQPPPAVAEAGEPGPTANAADLATGSVKVNQSLQHHLSKELQLYFDKIVTLLKDSAARSAQNTTDGQQQLQRTKEEEEEIARLQRANREESARVQRAALESLSNDPGLHPLAPYFTKLIADEVAGGLRSLPTLKSMLVRHDEPGNLHSRCLLLILMLPPQELASALLSNPHIQLEHYVHQLLPPVLTCLVAKTLGSSQEDHWSVRERAAALVRQVGRIQRFHPSLSLNEAKQHRRARGSVTPSSTSSRASPRRSSEHFSTLPSPSPHTTVGCGETLTLMRINLMMDGPIRSPGAVIGLAALGHATVSLLLVPQLQPYMARLQPILDGGSTAAGSTSSGVAASRRSEAFRVHGALLDAVSSAITERLLASTTAAAALPKAPLPGSRKRGPALVDADGDVAMTDAAGAATKHGLGGKAASEQPKKSTAAAGPSKKDKQEPRMAMTTGGQQFEAEGSVDQQDR